MKRCHMFVKGCTLSSANGTAAKECEAHHGVVLKPFSANWYHYIGQGQNREALNTI
jgi:hypothetical protein